VRNYSSYKSIWNEFKDKGVVMIGIHTPETKAERNVQSVKKKMDEAGLTFPIAIDNKTTMWHRYHNAYWPSVYVIDREGIARWGWAGELGWKGAKGEYHMRQRIQWLVDEAKGK